jgi:hypothetical protein
MADAVHVQPARDHISGHKDIQLPALELLYHLLALLLRHVTVHGIRCKSAGTEFFSQFDLATDKFYEQISQTQADQAENLDEATTVFSHELADANVVSLTTSDSGAIVALMMVDTWEIKPNSRTSAVTVSGDELLLLGAEGSRTGVSTRYGNMLLFYVPLASSDQKIRLLGATQSLLSIEVL